MILKTAVEACGSRSYAHPFGEQIKIPPTLRQAQGERDFGLLNCGF
jgi:hypothetical protein